MLSVTATGSKRYTSQEIVAATGLQIGTTVTEDEFKQAALQLSQTGAFGDAAYRYQYSSEGAKLEIQVTDAGLFVPAYFDNFVWFSDQSLMSTLRSRVPLFEGQLPVNGKLADEVSDALQAMLDERGVAGRVDYLRSGPDDGPINSFLYSVSAVTIHIHDIQFRGASAAELPALEAASSKLKGQDYQRSILRVQADKVFLPVFLEQGYLKASIADSDAKIVQQNDQETDVDVMIPVDPGLQYKATAIQLSGTKIVAADQLRRLIHQQLGQPANAVQLADDVEAMQKLYGTHGYMAAAIQVKPLLDDANSTVSYQLQVHEGVQYHMGDLDIQDLARPDRLAVAAVWSLAKGDPYDSSYPKRFVDQVLKQVLVNAEWSVSIREMPDPEDKSVDVNVKFDRKEAL